MDDIRKFNKSISIFILFLIIPYLIYGAYSIYTDEYKKEVTPGIYSAISTCRNASLKSVENIIFTDSAGAQLYNENDTTLKNFLVINTTRAIGIVGQYLLIYEMVQNHSEEIEGKTIYLLVIPSVFMDNLDQKYTFNYFIKPFYNDEFKSYLEEDVKEHIKTFPLFWASQLPLVKTTNWSVDYSNAKDFVKIKKYYISEFSMKYLKKLKELSNQYNFQFKIKSPYMRNDKKDISKDRMIQQIKENDFNDIFNNYFEDMNYIPDSVFIDRDHFNTDQYKVEVNPLNL